MRFLFDDQIADFEALRTAGYGASGGADLGEVLVTTSTLSDAAPEPWWAAWSSLADRLEGQAREAAARGHWYTAAGAWLRASNYYRNAEFFLHLNTTDPRIVETSAKAVDAFRDFTSLFPGHGSGPHLVGTARRASLPGLVVDEVSIPFEDAFLPGWWFTPAGDGSRPTLIALGGFDSTAEELYLAVGKVAVERCWNCLVLDGPGQGRALREQKMFYRPQWEDVVGAAIDVVVAQAGTDPSRIALLGMSQGGYFAPQAAAFEHRLAALVAWDGVYDVNAAADHLLPREALDLINQDEDARADELLLANLEHDHRLAWVVGNGMFSFGVPTPSAFVRALRAYTLAGGIAEKITCPTLIIDAEGEPFFVGQPSKLAQHLAAPHEIVRMRTADGAGAHCNAGSLHRFHDELFDWLNATLNPTSN